MKRMGEIIFDNPNKPEQPAMGVYRWFYVIAGREVTWAALEIGKSMAAHLAR